MTNFDNSGVVKVEPKRFLEAAAAAVAATVPITLDAPLKLPVETQLKLGPALDPVLRDNLIDLLFVRGIKFHTFTAITAYYGPEESIVLQAESGTLHFRGPLSTQPTAKKAVWSGMAERIQVFPNGDLHVINHRGVYGSIRDNASTHVFIGTEANGTMVVRSLDKDDSNLWRPLSGEVTIDTEKTFVSPHEVRIELDLIYGVRQVENYPKPTVLYLARVMHTNVVSTANTPSAGMSRIETVNPALGTSYHYFVAH